MKPQLSNSCAITCPGSLTSTGVTPELHVTLAMWMLWFWVCLLFTEWVVWVSVVYAAFWWRLTWYYMVLHEAFFISSPKIGSLDVSFYLCDSILLWNFALQIDGKVSMNGEAFNGVEDEQERECTALIFAPSPSRLSKADNVEEEVDGASKEKQDSTSTELVLKRLIEHSKHREQTVRTTPLDWP